MPSPEERALDEFQCVMLRNAGHLYDGTESRQLLNRSRNAFTRLGLRFGAATATNNLGVVALWGGHHRQAERELSSARAQLEDLGSNEVYQPLINLAVLRILQGNHVE